MRQAIYKVEYYKTEGLMLTMEFYTHTGAMNSAKQYVSRGRAGYKAIVAKHATPFAWFNRPCKLE